MIRFIKAFLIYILCVFLLLALFTAIACWTHWGLHTPDLWRSDSRALIAILVLWLPIFPVIHFLFETDTI